MDLLTGLTDLFKQAGGWGVAAIAIYGLTRVYLDKSRESKEIGVLLEQRHKQFVTMLEESIRLKTSLSSLMEQNLEIQSKLLSLLGRVDKAITGCERANNE